MLAEVYAPEAALSARFIDRLLPAVELQAAAKSAALEFAKLDIKAHAATKLRDRGAMLRAMRAAIELDSGSLIAQGVQRFMEKSSVRATPRSLKKLRRPLQYLTFLGDVRESGAHPRSGVVPCLFIAFQIG